MGFVIRPGLTNVLELAPYASSPSAVLFITTRERLCWYVPASFEMKGPSFMHYIYAYLLPGMWFIFLAYWRSLAADVKVTERREAALSRIVRLLLFVLAAALLALPSVPFGLLNKRFLPQSSLWFWVGAVVTASGLSFSVWARLHLGNNWSQAVTIKEGHELITSGPYALVRHPIYTGLLLGFLGSAIARGEWRGLLALALIFGALWHKLSLEESWMSAQFGEAYAEYSRRVAALVPYLI